MIKLMTIFKDRSESTIFRYYAFSFFKSMAFFSAVLVPFFTDWGHISLIQVQLLQSWFMLWVFLLEVPTGAVADYFGRKASIALGALVFGVASIIYGSIPNFVIFLLGEFMAALGVSLISGADDALLYDALKEEGKQQESTRVFGRARAIELGGIFTSAILGGFIAQRFGLNAPMQFTAIPFFIAALIAWSIKEPKIKESKKTKRYLDIAKKGLIFFYQHKVLRLLAIDSILVASAAYFIIWLYQPLLKSIYIPILYFGFVHAALVASQMIVSDQFATLEKIFKTAKNFIRFSAVVTCLGFILVALFPSLLTVLFFILVAGGFGLTRGEFIGIYMNKFIESHQRATVLSSISMFRRLILVLLNPIVGFTADSSLTVALLLVGILPLVVFLFSPIEQEMFETEKDIIS